MACSGSTAAGDRDLGDDPGSGPEIGPEIVPGEADFHVDAVRTPEGATLMVGGSLVGSCVPLLVACLESSLRRGAGFVRLDLSRVRQVDEVAASALRLLAHVVDRSGSTLSLAAPRRLWGGTLARCGLDISPVEDAVAAPELDDARLAGVR